MNPPTVSLSFASANETRIAHGSFPVSSYKIFLRSVALLALTPNPFFLIVNLVFKLAR